MWRCLIGEFTSVKRREPPLIDSLPVQSLQRAVVLCPAGSEGHAGSGDAQGAAQAREGECLVALAMQGELSSFILHTEQSYGFPEGCYDVREVCADFQEDGRMLGKPVHIIKGVEEPFAIALNKSGHLVTLPRKGVVAALSKDGRVVPGGKDGLGRPRGIAIGEDGSLLVTSDASEQLMKFNKDWTLAKTVGQKGDQTGIDRVKFSHTTRKYYVCDWGNHCMQVFGQDLKHVSSFGRHGSKLGELNHPFEVAFDDAGCVYV